MAVEVAPCGETTASDIGAMTPRVGAVAAGEGDLTASPETGTAVILIDAVEIAIAGLIAPKFVMSVEGSTTHTSVPLTTSKPNRFPASVTGSNAGAGGRVLSPGMP